MKDDISRAYQILEVEAECSLSELKQSRKELSLVWHPDRFAHDEKLQEKALRKTQEINSAYDLVTKLRKSSSSSGSPTAKEGSTSRSGTMEVEGRDSKQIAPPIIPLKMRIALALGFGVLLLILLIALSNRFFDQSKNPTSNYSQIDQRKSVEVRDESYLIRQQMSQRMQTRVEGYLQKKLGRNRFKTRVDLEVDPSSQVVLLARVSITLDGEGVYDRDQNGSTIGQKLYTSCSPTFQQQISRSISQILRLVPSRGDRVDVNCYNFSKKLQQ